MNNCIASPASPADNSLVADPVQKVQAFPVSQPAHLLCAPPGTGKTHAVIRALAEKGTQAIYCAPTHALCKEVAARMKHAGIHTHYWREGPDEGDACPHASLVEFYRRFGYFIWRGPCKDCDKQSKCSYRRVFTCPDNHKAQVLIMTGWHMRRPELWDLRATLNRNLVIIDEDATQALAAPSELHFDALARFVAGLQAVRDQCTAPFKVADHSDIEAWLIRKLMKPRDGNEAKLALTDILRRAAVDLMALCSKHAAGQWIPAAAAENLSDYDRMLLRNHDLFESLLAMAYEAISQKVEIPNVFAALQNLLLNPQPLHASRGAIRWTSVSTVPDDAKLVLLDATAEPSVVGGILGRPVEVLSVEPVEQQAKIYQVMDRLLTRSGTRRDIAEDDGFILSFLRAAAVKHRKQQLLVVTFLEHEETLQKFMKAHHPAATVIHYGALRGLDVYGNYGAGIIIGRPMPNEARLSLLAVSAFGMDALSQRLLPPPIEWTLTHYPLHEDLWQVRCQKYGDPRWDAVWTHVVTGELLQAIGRLRPLSNPADIYLLTCEPVPPLLAMQGLYAGDLFPELLLKNRRSDFQVHAQAYAAAYCELVEAGQKPTNRAVCERLGIHPQNGLRYKELALIAGKETDSVSAQPVDTK